MILVLCLLGAGPIEESRALQRERGYLAALEHLEANLGTWEVADHYVRVCSWAGEERRGLAALDRAPLPREQRDWAKADLYVRMAWFREAAELGARCGKPAEWVAWAHARADRRERLLGRGRRAGVVAAVAAAAVAIGAFLAFRFAPPPETS